MNTNPETPFRPYFDMELFLTTAEERQIPGPELEALLELWESWSDALHMHELTQTEPPCLALWLDEAVEAAVDAAWKESPTRGFRLNALAQTLCMCAVHERVPEVEDAGCAPAPRLSAGLVRQIRSAGLPCGDNGTLGRRYAVLTPFPFRGGCEICALQEQCPRSGGTDAHSVVLPGHEPG